MMLLPFLFLGCFAISHLPGTHAQLLTDRPMFIDQLLQTVWDPGSLIHWWTALDQFYNIALGWRRAARSVATLPFREGRSMDHVRIKEPRRSKMFHRQLDLPHWERFNQVYSSQQPVAAAPSVHLPVVQQYPLPPPFLFHPQEAFPGFNRVPGWSQNNIAMANRDDESTKQIKKYLQTKLLLDKMLKSGVKATLNKPGQPVVGGAPIPMLFFNSNGAQNSSPEARLRMFLKLMKKLGEIHTSSVKFDDSKDESGYDR